MLLHDPLRATGLHGPGVGPARIGGPGVRLAQRQGRHDAGVDSRRSRRAEWGYHVRFCPSPSLLTLPKQRPCTHGF